MWTMTDKLSLEGFAYNGPAWVRRFPCANGRYLSEIVAAVPLCTLNYAEKRFNAPILPHTFLFVVHGIDRSGQPHIIQSDRFHDLSASKRQATIRASAQAGW